jgi:3-phosphoshikimate 1-carboxyvinyltransferase
MTRRRRLIVGPSGPLHGVCEVPGDKSLSHRVALFGAMASGVTEARNFLMAEDCLRLLAAVEALGCRVEHEGAHLRIHSQGVEAWHAPADVLDCGNSGTAMRLLLGALAGRPFSATLDGDESLRTRPMGRVAEPLRLLGADISCVGDKCVPPLTISGGNLRPITYDLPVASAQVKSAILLAGLQAEGTTVLNQPSLSRDHTERLLPAFGARVTIDGLAISISGPQSLRHASINVPGDFSSAAYLLAAAVLVPSSEVVVENLGLNRTRSGLLEILEAMRADVRVGPLVSVGGEPRGDVTIVSGPLRAIEVSGEIIPRAIDELPLLAVLATQAQGETVLRDAAELRVKESDRLESVAAGLTAMGAKIRVLDDGWVISGPTPLHGATLDAGLDHRVAMTLAVAGLLADGETIIDGAQAVATSFPGFAAVLSSLGAQVTMQ